MKSHYVVLSRLWLFLGATCVVLIGFCFVYLPEILFDDVSRGHVPRARNQTLFLLAFLAGAVNFLFYLMYRIDPNGKLVLRLNIPNKKFWLSTPENRVALTSKMKNVSSAMGNYVNFLIATTLYMKLHYYYPWALVCPRHLLMILIWLVLTIVVGVYTVLQLKAKPT